MTKFETLSHFVLTQADNEELNTLIQYIKMRRQQITKATVRAVTKGAAVSFQSKTGKVTGIVDRMGHKNIYVRVAKSGTFGQDIVWRVPASMVNVEA
jgi:hypothetical protein